MPKILLLGDYAPRSCSVVLQDFPDVDIVVANMEGPLLEPHEPRTPALKAGPPLSHMHCPLVREGTHWIFSLANNHIMDFGYSAARGTMKKLEALGCSHVGLGANEEKARKVLFRECKGKIIAVIAAAEKQFGDARDAHPGHAAIGPWMYEAIRQARERADYVIVSVHAGLEMSPLPSPGLRDLYRSYIDAGAHIVHGHHSHVPQLVERWKEGVIAYGLGNFATPVAKWENTPDGLWSIALTVDLSGACPEETVSFFEVVRNGAHQGDTIYVRPGEEREYAARQEELSALFNEAAVYNAIWQETALHYFMSYGHEFLFQDQNIARRGERDWPLGYHIVCCQSHREMAEEAMGILGGVVKYFRSPVASAYCKKYLRA